jgi:hypothetical protein
MELPSNFYPTAFKVSYLVFIIPTLLVVVTSILSAKAMGGTLGKGLRKIAAGSIIHTSIISAYLLIEAYSQEPLNENLIRFSFVVNGIAGSILLILGFVQLYRIAKQLKLFTP